MVIKNLKNNKELKSSEEKVDDNIKFIIGRPGSGVTELTKNRILEDVSENITGTDMAFIIDSDGVFHLMAIDELKKAAGSKFIIWPLSITLQKDGVLQANENVHINPMDILEACDKWRALNNKALFIETLISIGIDAEIYDNVRFLLHKALQESYQKYYLAIEGQRIKYVPRLMPTFAEVINAFAIIFRSGKHVSLSEIEVQQAENIIHKMEQIIQSNPSLCEHTNIEFNPGYIYVFITNNRFGYYEDYDELITMEYINTVAMNNVAIAPDATHTHIYKCGSKVKSQFFADYYYEILKRASGNHIYLTQMLLELPRWMNGRWKRRKDG